MRIEYIWIENYKGILENMNINFGGKKSYTYDVKGNKITDSVNESYINNFFTPYNVIEQINSIIGENGVGKTSILRLINDIFGNNQQLGKYIIIYKYENRNYGYNNFQDLLYSFNDIIWIKNKSNNLIQDSGHVVNIIYFSSVFDKSRILSGNKRLYNICTSKLVEDFFSKYKYNQFEIINEFRRQEIPKVLRFFNYACENINKDNLLFNIPTQLYMYIDTMRINYKNEIAKYKGNGIDDFITMVNYISDFYKNQINNCIDNVDFKSSFIVLGMIEILIDIVHSILNKENYVMKDEVKDLLIDLKFYYGRLKEDNTIKNYFEADLYQIILRFIAGMYNNPNVKANEIIFSDISSEVNNISSKLNELKDYIDNISIWFEKQCLAIDEEEKNEKLSEIEELINVMQEIDIELDFLVKKQNNYYKEDLIKQYPVSRYLNEENGIIEDKEEDLNGNLKKNTYSEKEYIFFQSIKSLIREFEELKEVLEYYSNVEYEYIEDIINNFYDIFDEIEQDKVYAQSIVDIFNEYIDKQHRDVNLIKDENINKFRDYLNKCEEYLRCFRQIVYEGDSQQYEITDSEDETKKIKSIRAIINPQNEYFKNFLNKNIELNFFQDQFYFDWDDLSSGQNSYLDMVSRLYSLSCDNNFYESVKNIVFLIDEGELYLHPNAQIKFINNLVSFINKLFCDKKIHIILTSNSPFTVSDLPSKNVIYILKNGTKNEIKESEGLTFGANIHMLLSDTFYMRDGTIGSFAHEKIQEIKRLLLDEEKFKNEIDNKNVQLQDVYNTIKSIGEPLIKEKLMQLFYEKKKYIEEIYSHEVKKLVGKFKELSVDEKRQFIKEIIKGDN